MSQAQGFPEDHNEDAYLEYPHGVTILVIYETPKNRRNIRESKACFIAKLVDTLSTDARRNFLIVILRGNGDNDTSKTRPQIFKDVGIS
jgi:hypothetical protein